MWNGGCGFLGRGMIGGGWLMMIIPILLIGLAIYALIKISNSSNRLNSFESNSALAILDEKLANGEIDEEEYARKKKVLRR